jgi:hypothetical protein
VLDVAVAEGNRADGRAHEHLLRRDAGERALASVLLLVVEELFLWLRVAAGDPRALALEPVRAWPFDHVGVGLGMDGGVQFNAHAHTRHLDPAGGGAPRGAGSPRTRGFEKGYFGAPNFFPLFG